MFAEVIPHTNEWIAIGLQLEISMADIERIKIDHNTEKERFGAIFDKWKRTAVPCFTWNTLVNILNSPSVQEHKLAEDIRNKYIAQSQFVV